MEFAAQRVCAPVSTLPLSHDAFVIAGRRIEPADLPITWLRPGERAQVACVVDTLTAKLAIHIAYRYATPRQRLDCSIDAIFYPALSAIASASLMPASPAVDPPAWSWERAARIVACSSPGIGSRTTTSRSAWTTIETRPSAPSAGW